jgi:hypothetical protein
MSKKPPYEKPWWIEHEEMKKRKRREARGVTDEHEKHVKQGKASKRKGKRREKGWGEFVCKLIGGEAIVRHGDRDVQFINNGLEFTHSEVKGRKAFAFIKHCKQAALDSAHHGLPRYVVACKADRERWYCIVDAVDYVMDMAELRDLRTIVDALKLEGRMKDEGAVD